MEWFRVHHGTVTDAKWRTVARRAAVKVHEVVSVWLAMMEHASQATPRGTLSGWSDEVAGDALDMDPNAIERIRTHMNGLVLDGERIPAWDRRQPKREDGSAERAKAWREAQKTAKTSPANAIERNRTQSNAEQNRTEQSRQASHPSTATARVTAPAGPPKGSAGDAPQRPKISPPASGNGGGRADLATHTANAPRGAARTPAQSRPETALAAWWLDETEARWPGSRAVSEVRVLAIERSMSELLGKHGAEAIRAACADGLARYRDKGHREPPKMPTIFRSEIDAEAVKQSRATAADPRSERAFRLRYWLDRDCATWLPNWGDPPADRAAAERELAAIKRTEAA